MHNSLIVALFSFSLACTVQANEKVYLHLDQNAYFLGETMWFCAYVNDTKTNRPTELSRVLYVELVAPEGNVVKTVVCKIENGRGAGSIELEKSFLSGLFEIRAYTRYMCNWADNYYSRILPVFDTVKDGNYESRTMYDRRRAVMTKKERKIYNRNINDAKTKTAAKRKAMTVDTRPLKLSIETLPNDMKPQEKVVLKLHGEPNTSFSLSIKDGGSEVHTNYHGNIADDLVNNNDWLVAEALSANATRIQHFAQPEKSITLRGQLMRKSDYEDIANWTFMTGVPNASVSMDFASYSYKYEPLTIKTDSTGWFQVSLGDVSEFVLAKLQPSYDSKNPRAIRIDKWFSPKTRNYPDSIYKLTEASLPKTEGIDRNGKEQNTLGELVVKGKRRNYGWHQMVHSLTHTNIIEECEWIIDNDEANAEIYANGGIKDIDFEYTMLEHHGYASDEYKYKYPYRSIFLDDAYPGDSIVPECRNITDNVFNIPFWEYKEIVVRSDRAICERYSKSNRSAETLLSNNRMIGGNRISSDSYIAGKYIGGDVSLSQSPIPSLIVCYIPYKTNERRNIYVNYDPKTRYTVVHGFTPQKKFKGNGRFRRTLYWNPSVTTDENGDATIEFLNNSTCRELSISAEGLTDDGRPFYK